MCGVDCEQLRARLREAKRTRDAAHVSNAVAVGSGLDVPWSPADIRAFQHEVDVAAQVLTESGCDDGGLRSTPPGHL